MDESESETYSVVYQATKDALWDVIGTVVFAIVLAVIFLIGLQIVLFSLTAVTTGGGFIGLLIGVALVGASALRFLTLFDLLPGV